MSNEHFQLQAKNICFNVSVSFLGAGILATMRVNSDLLTDVMMSVAILV